MLVPILMEVEEVITTNSVNPNAVGIYNVIYTAFDAVGNIGTATRTVIVNDNTPPVITITGASGLTIERYSTYSDPGANSNGGEKVYTDNQVKTSIANTYNVIYTATDAAGNTGTATRTVTVQDTTAPVITLNGLTTVTIEKGTDYTDSGATADGTETVNKTTDTVNSALAGTYNVIYTATDVSGNTGTATRTVIVADTTSPVITISGDNLLTISKGDTYTDAGTVFNTDIVGTVITTNSVNPNAVGIYNVIYTAFDAVGNKGTATRIVIVNDNTPPVITITGASGLTIERYSTYSDPGANSNGGEKVYTDNQVKTSIANTYNVIYTATDAAGNTGTATRTVTVQDTTAPVITLNGLTTVTIEKGTDYTDSGATADGTETVNKTTDTVNSALAGTYNVIYTATDVSGNTGTATRTVIVADTTSPVITISGDNLLTISKGDTYTDAGTVFNTDIVGTVITTNSVNPNAVGIYNVIYTAFDAVGNKGTATRIVIVNDNTPPVITITGASGLTIERYSTYSDPGANSNGGEKVYTDNQVKTSIANTYNVIYTATDAAGNTGTATRTVTVQDTTAPVITLNGLTTVTIEKGTDYTDSGATADGTETVNKTTDTVNSALAGTYNVIYTATDVSGNTGTATRTVIVADTTSPVITISGDNLLTISKGDTYTDAGTVFNTDIVGTVITTNSVNPNAVGIYNVIYTAFDAVGNKGTATRIVIVNDNTPPVITITGASGLTIERYSTYSDPGANSNGGEKVYTDNQVKTSIANTYNVIYTATDAAGNTGTATRTVTVQDTTAPVITLNGLTTVTIEKGTDYTDSGATADGTETVNKTTDTVNSALAGTYNVIYTATDVSGNTGTATRTVIVADTTSPVITISGDNLLTISKGDTYTDAGTVFNTDIVGTVITTNSVNPNAVGIYNVIYTAFDAVGNKGTATRIVIVNDNTPPVITITGASGLTIERYSTYSDPGANSNGGEKVYTDNQVKTSIANTYNVIYTATDAAGNTGTATRTVTVQDTTAPVITLNGLTTVTIEKGTDYTDSGATADGTETVNKTTDTVNSALAGTYNVIYTATDVSGNTGTATRTVIVADTTSPVITISGDNLLTISKGDTYTDAGTVFNTDIVGTVITTNSVNPNAVGIYNVIYTAFDAVGNKGTATRIVIVNDNTPPVITITGASGLTIERYSTYSDPGANSNGGEKVYTDNQVKTSIANTYNVIYTATDAAGNTGTATRTVTVQDTTAPVITLNGLTTVTIEKGTDYTDSGATADGTETVNKTTDTVNSALAGTYNVIYTATDVSGNTGTATRTVIVADTTSPVITISGDNLLTISKGDTYTDAGTVFNTDIVGTVITTNSVNPNAVGIYNVIYTAFDAVGNKGTATRIVIVNDNTPPVITITGASGLTIERYSTYSDPGANSNGGEKVYTDNQVKTSIANTYNVIYTATDAAGNTGTATRTVTVQDTTAPVITLNGLTTVTIEKGTDYTDSGATADGTETVNKTTDTVNSALAGTYNVIYTATDVSGNTGTATRTVIVADTTSPVITISGDNLLTISKGDTYTDAGTVFNTDIVGTVITTNSVNPNAVGIYNVIYTAFDAVGNKGTATRIVIVNDDTPPVITITGASGLTIERYSTYSDPGANSNGGEKVYTDNQVKTSIANTYNVIYTATDAAGNTGTATRTVTVQDTTAPVITLNGLTTVTIEKGTDYTDSGATADGGEFVYDNSIQVNPLIVGTYYVTYTATDDNDNPQVGIITRTVIVEDKTPPVVTINSLPATDSQIQYIERTDASITWSDPGAATTEGEIVASGSVDTSKLGLQSIIYTATDAFNNVTTATRQVVVRDTLKPVITIIGSTTLSHEKGIPYVDDGFSVSPDASGWATNGVITHNTGKYYVTYNAQDSHLHADTKTRTVIVLGYQSTRSYYSRGDLFHG